MNIDSLNEKNVSSKVSEIEKTDIDSLIKEIRNVFGGKEKYLEVESLSGLDLSDQNIEEVFLGREDGYNDSEAYVVSDVNFSNCRIKNIINSLYSNLILRNCNFNGAQITDFTFKDIKFENCDMTGVTFAGVSFPPNCFDENTKFSEEYQLIDGILFGPGLVIDYIPKELSTDSLKGLDLSGCQFERLNLKHFNLQDVNLSGSRFSSVDLRGADLSGLDLSKCMFDNVSFYYSYFDESTKFPDGYQLIDGILFGPGLVMIESISPWFPKDSLKGLDLSGCTFRNVNFESIDFSNCNLTGVKFKGCSFKSNDFYNASLKGTSFSDCCFEDIDFTVSKFIPQNFSKDNRIFGVTFPEDYDLLADKILLGPDTLCSETDFDNLDLSMLSVDDFKRIVRRSATFKNVIINREVYELINNSDFTNRGNPFIRYDIHSYNDNDLFILRPKTS